MLIIVAPLQELWGYFLVCIHSRSVFKNCIGFCSSFLTKVLLTLDWHSMVFTLLFSQVGISSCHGILGSQSSFAVLSNWDYKGTDYLFHQASRMFWSRQVCILLCGWLKKFELPPRLTRDIKSLHPFVSCLSPYLLFLVQWTLIVSVCKTLSCWMLLSVFHWGLLQRHF